MISAVFQKKDVTIDGVTFGLREVNAVEMSPLWLGLMKSVGPGIAAAGTVEGAGAALAAFGAVVESLPADFVKRLADTFANHCEIEVNGKRPELAQVFGHVFAGRPVLYFKWLFECVRFNCSDFLSDEQLEKLKVRLAGLVAEKASVSKSPNT